MPGGHVRHPSPEVGLYRLRCDVVNPRGDRRVKHDPWKQPVWPAGSLFVVEEDADIGGVFLRMAKSHSQMGFLAKNAHMINAIVPNLERVLFRASPTVEPGGLDEALLYAKHCKHLSAESVLRRLVEMGKVSVDAVLVAAEWKRK